MDNKKWYAQDIEVNSDPLIDPGTGKAVFIRQFMFKHHQDTLKRIQAKELPSPSDQQLFDQAWSVIRPILWGDGLVANQDITPKIARGNNGYTVIIACEAKLGQTVIDRPNNLTALLKPKPFTKRKK